MKIKYKNTRISNTPANSVCVEYTAPDPDNKQRRFFFSYRAHKNGVIDKSGIVEVLFFKAGMDWAPQRMKVTMEDLKSKFAIFKENGSGTIEDFLSFILAQERNEKLEKLGI